MFHRYDKRREGVHVVNFDDDSEVPNELRGVHGVAHNRQRRESSDGFTEEGGAETRSKEIKEITTEEDGIENTDHEPVNVPRRQTPSCILDRVQSALKRESCLEVSA